MVRRIAFDDGHETSGAVRRRGERWREERRVEEHRHRPVTPEDRARRMEERYRKRGRIAPAGVAEDRGPVGRLLRNPLALILGFVFFNVAFIAFLILRAIWLARMKRAASTMNV